MPRNTPDYDQDFYAWTLDQGRRLRSGQLAKIDIENLAEEVESLGRRERRELGDRLGNLLADLLKWRCQFGARCGDWRSSILSQRFEIEQILEDSPSLRSYAPGQLEELYSGARQRVVEELGLLQPDFPSECPFSLDQVLSHSFFAEG